MRWTRWSTTQRPAVTILNVIDIMGSIQKILDHHDWAAAMATIIICVAVSSAALAIYRLCFSPLALAGVPGPKIAAITAWYEFYWDCVQQGRYLFKIEQMHQKYGPYLLFFFYRPNHTSCSNVLI